MEDRDRAAPIALARYAPVAQAIVDLTLGGGPIAADFSLQPLRDLLFRIGYRQPVEEPRIDHPTVTIVGNVGDNEGFRILSFRAHDRGVSETIPVGEIKIALVMGR